jgi:subtilisin-like proprotein convertase family protein
MTQAYQARALWAVVVAAVLAVSLLVLVVAASQPAAAASKFKTVTKTFSNTSAITIPELPPSTVGKAAPYPSKINVSGLKQGKIIDVNLTLKNLTHGHVDDVAVVLVGPKGNDAITMSDVGGHTANDITLMLDDEAATNMPDNSALTTGAFKPTQGTSTPELDQSRPSIFPGINPPYGAFLSDFDGTNPNGTWKLFIYDDSESWNGSLAGGWSITIKARVLK